jgi:hypothetical protein
LVSEPFDEKFYQRQISAIRINKLNEAKERYGIENLGNHLGDVLENTANDVVNLVVLRSAHKFLSGNSYQAIKELLDSGTLTIQELWNLSTSIANTLRPLAGHTFASWVAVLLGNMFDKENLPLAATTKGEVKSALAKQLELQDSEKMQDLKPDIDIVVYDKRNKKPILIISCKTTLAERVMQTIRWSEFVSLLPAEARVKVFLVTAWEDFKEKTQRQRVSGLDGVYVTNETVQVGGNIKYFNQIYDDIKALSDE